MKLLYITNGINGPGGLERVLSIKASYLADHYGYEVTILSLNENNLDTFYEFSSKIEKLSISVSGNPFQYIKAYRSGIKKIVKEVKPDIISVCDDGLKGMLFPVLFGTKTPVIYERHVSKQIELRKDKLSLTQQITSRIKFKLMNSGGKRFHKFVVLTKENLKEWNLNNLQVIPNPLPFQTNKLSSLKNKKVLAVGKQSYQKGYDRLIESWKFVHQKHPDWQLNVFGKLDPSLGLESLVSQLKVNNTINFYPPEKNIQERYKEASIYVMSSRFEGFGMVLIEAMEYGVPCISFDCPHGPADIIEHEKDGVLIKKGDTEAFATSIIRLIENEEERVRMGKLAKQHVQRFAVNKIVAQWDVLFKSLTSK